MTIGTDGPFAGYLHIEHDMIAGTSWWVDLDLGEQRLPNVGGVQEVVVRRGEDVYAGLAYMSAVNVGPAGDATATARGAGPLRGPGLPE